MYWSIPPRLRGPPLLLLRSLEPSLPQPTLPLLTLRIDRVAQRLRPSHEVPGGYLVDRPFAQMSRRTWFPRSSADLMKRGKRGLFAETPDSATNRVSVRILARLSALGSPSSSQS